MQDPFHSPESLLASFLSQSRVSHRLILLTGPSGSGKTTYCLELVSLAVTHSIDLNGLVSPPIFDGDFKIGIDLADIASGEKRRLAHHRNYLKGNLPAKISGPATDDWQFDNHVFVWGNKVLERSNGYALFILDELGPLEFNRNQGLISGLQHINIKRYHLGVIVVRPALLTQARTRWPWGELVQTDSFMETR